MDNTPHSSPRPNEPNAPEVFELVESLEAVPEATWDDLGRGHPLLAHRFLSAFQKSGAVGGQTGWIPRYGLLRRAGIIVGAVPLYLKTHSYGEYVFDWSWAQALEEAGEPYYPKLLCALPFTPVSSPRLLAHDASTRLRLAQILLGLPKKLGVSSCHLLFPTEDDLAALRQAGLLIRSGIQFHWQARGAQTFEEVLAAMTSEKRKKIRQERRKVKDSGVRCRIKTGAQILESDWRFFFRCYQETYRLHRSSPYLNLDFFMTLGRVWSDHVMMVIADLDGAPVASALNFFDGHRLWGRYWGALTFIPGLHFEVCYYQGIEFCLDRQIEIFEGGAQGEHKLARGFEPVTTYSAHALAHPGLHKAVDRFLERETEGIEAYRDELEAHAPFRRSV